jgi:hypothetical protein
MGEGVLLLLLLLLLLLVGEEACSGESDISEILTVAGYINTELEGVGSASNNGN